MLNVYQSTTDEQNAKSAKINPDENNEQTINQDTFASNVV